MRTLLDMIRENETLVQEMAARIAVVLEQARQLLANLDPEVGDGELIQALAAAVANLRMP